MTGKALLAKVSKDSGLDLTTLVLGALLLLPPAISFIVLYLSRLPFPYQDDFKGLLAFALQYDRAPRAAAKALSIAVIRHNEYRLIFQHLIVAAEVEITHRVNFIFLTTLGDMFLIGIAILLWCSFDRGPLKRKLLYFLPISLLFFGLSYWETLNWALASLQNLPVIFFAFMALYFLIPRDHQVQANYRFMISCIAACLSCCASANGFLLAPVGITILASRRCYKQFILWMLSFALPFCAYRYHALESPTHYSFHPTQIFYFIAFLGGVYPGRFIAFLIGAIILAILAWAAYSRLTQRSPVLFFLAVWIVLTSAIVEAFRVSISSRYSIYSVLLLICCYDFALNTFDENRLVSRRLLGLDITRKHFLQLVTALALLFYLQADIHAYLHLNARREMVVAGFKYYRLDPYVNSPQANPEVDRLFPDEKPFELDMLDQVARAHLYVVPSEQELQKRW
jgi:hypothetical protein